jgi:hypothetical protein
VISILTHWIGRYLSVISVCVLLSSSFAHSVEATAGAEGPSYTPVVMAIESNPAKTYSTEPSSPPKEWNVVSLNTNLQSRTLARILAIKTVRKTEHIPSISSSISSRIEPCFPICDL